MSETWLALLRGINVGGKNKLPMKDLTAIFVAARCTEVRSYIQSGNIIFQASPAASARLPGVISASIASRFGYKVPVVLRTLEQIAKVLADNPFLEAGAAEDELHVMFLADTPALERVAALDPDRSPPDTFEVLGQEIYLRLPNGVADSKLTNVYFDSKLATVGTARNWRTVNKLFELMRG
jgi:uncharacterized protein (DUF1697 family)